ncbi:helix-turn-helix domain-containing protein [Tenacibaculum agarivorans]|uniref:helix-turn-helix domain-containing protein n=1 Tax=Tenacibaculum agarivorans TaxID=1908389 RepID=UPI00094B80D5|nr:response regulator transcription factor [Tenacibaculum agarivorans]
MNLNFFNVLIFSGIVQGITFGYPILTASIYKNVANKFLALAVIALSLGNLNFWFLDTGLLKKYPVIDWFLVKWHLVFPVFFYFYIIRSLGLKNNKLILFFIPSFISLVTRCVSKTYYYIYEQYLFDTSIFYLLEEYIALFFTLFLGIKAYSHFKKLKKDTQAMNIEWFRDLFKVSLGLYMLWFFSFTLMVFAGTDATYLFYPLLLLITLLFFWIDYKGLHLLNIVSEKEISIRTDITKEKIFNTTPKNKTVSENNPTYTKLKSLVETKEVYKDSNISLDSIALLLEVSPNYLSQVVNKVTGQNFSSYINTYRVEEIKKTLVNPEFDKYSILSIGLEVGFNSKSAFYTTFKKQTGMTPKQYKDQYSTKIISG